MQSAQHGSTEAAAASLLCQLCSLQHQRITDQLRQFAVLQLSISHHLQQPYITHIQKLSGQGEQTTALYHTLGAWWPGKATPPHISMLLLNM